MTSGSRAQRLVGGDEQRELVLERDGERVDLARPTSTCRARAATGASSTAGPATSAEALAMATASRATRTASSAVTSREEAKPHAPSADGAHAEAEAVGALDRLDDARGDLDAPRAMMSTTRTSA